MDPPEDADFRREFRAWLDRTAPRRGGPGDFSQRPIDPSLPPDRQQEREAAHARRCLGWQRTLYDAGFACVAWPVEYGGRGGTAAHARIVAAEQAAYGVSSAALSVGLGMVGPTLLAHGTPEQRARHLPPLARGEALWCQLFSESGAGSDLAGLSTRAERAGTGWRVTGQKVWSSGAAHADFGVLLARTDPERPRHGGISYFVVDMSAPGVEARPIRQITGAAHFCEVFLTDVPLPADALVGALNDGWRVANTMLSSERALIGGRSLDGGAALWSIAVERGLTGDTAVRELIGRVHAAERVLALLNAGTHPPSVAKLLVADYRRRLAEAALRLSGSAGLLDGPDAPAGGHWQRELLNAPQYRIAGGTDQIQRNIIGERVLCLPREPRP
jgi:alkylation response protein AidB-like acyl-CoA dehydrogenase